ncbi:MAG: polysaccharide biosynthesis tyrosine autokinase [Acidobacteria bacterium]|nr:polysaccharide biosynthesis tyrosine autokinase [Acidobacteriota bacterium]
MDEIEIQQPNPSNSLVKAEFPAALDPGILEVAPEGFRHLHDYLQIILKRRWAVLTCFIVVFSSVAIGTLKQKPIYQGQVLIEINPEQPNVLNFKEVLQISGVDVDSYRETQYKVLQSRTLADRVVQTLHLYRNPEFYRNRGLFGLYNTDPEILPSKSDSDPPDVLGEYYRNSLEHFTDSISVRPVRRSNLVEVAFYSEDRKLAARIANQLANDYIEQNLQVKWDETVKASEWLQGQLIGLKAKLEKSEDALQAYAQANSILFVEEKKNLANERMAQLQTEYTKAQSDRFQKEALYGLVQEGKVQDLPGFLSNRLVQDLAVRLSELERDYAQLTSTVKPDYPKAVGLKNQIDTLQGALERQKKALAQNIVDEYTAAVANEKYLADALEGQKKEVNEIAERSIQYNILKREVDTSKQLYEGLLQRLKESQVSAGLKASNVRIVDSAEEPQKPVKPRVLLNLALGVIVGLGLGIGLAFFQEYLDNTIKTPDEVENLLRLPSLGVLPSMIAGLEAKGTDGKSLSLASTKQTPQLAPAVQTNPQYLEAFRSLRTSILLSANPVPKLLLITSALPGEGKTTTTVNLGATLASLGNKVVIVDCDMRRPACHRSTGVQNKPGFVQCLTGQVDLVEAILPVPGVENLHVIPCGPIPPNPAEVLSASLTFELLRRLRGEFEYVLVDSPPLLSVADSRILATAADAVVLVVRAFSTPYDAVRRARSLLYGAGARILGVALNDVDIRREGYSYSHYYRYGYGYGYGYGSHPSEESAHQEEKS